MLLSKITTSCLGRKRVDDALYIFSIKIDMMGNVIVDNGVVSQISQQVMTSPAPGDRYTRGFLTGRARVFSLFMALTYAMTSPTWPL